MVILHVRLEMLREVTDALAEESDLDFGRSRVALVRAEFSDQLGFAFCKERHEMAADYMFCRASVNRIERVLLRALSG